MFCSLVTHLPLAQQGVKTHFLLEHRCEVYSLLDHSVADFGPSFVSILADTIETPDYIQNRYGCHM